MIHGVSVHGQWVAYPLVQLAAGQLRQLDLSDRYLLTSSVSMLNDSASVWVFARPCLDWLKPFRIMYGPAGM
jgi:hypothetical protein